MRWSSMEHVTNYCGMRRGVSRVNDAPKINSDPGYSEEF
jgi:hypothetical protein